jgi:hypothetical protein
MGTAKRPETEWWSLAAVCIQRPPELCHSSGVTAEKSTGLAQSGEGAGAIPQSYRWIKNVLEALEPFLTSLQSHFSFLLTQKQTLFCTHLLEE